MASTSTSKEQQDPLSHLLTPPQIPKLWLIDNDITNYVVWSTRVHDQFNRDGQLGFIDVTKMPSRSQTSGISLHDAGSWSEESDRCAKERLLFLIDQDIALTDPGQKTCRDIWLQLSDRFLPLVNRKEAEQPEGVHEAAGAGTLSSGKYMKLHKAALSGTDKWAAKHIFINDVGEMIRNNVIAPAMRNDDNQVYKLGGSVFPQDTEPIYSRHDLRSYLFYDSLDFSNRSKFSDTARLGLLISAIDAGDFKYASELLGAAPYLAGLKVSNKSAITCLVSNSNQVTFGRKNTNHRKKIFPRALPFKGVDSVLYFIYDHFQLHWGISRGLVVAAFLGIPALVASVYCCMSLIILNTLYWLPWKFLRTLGFLEKKPENVQVDDNALKLINDLCTHMKELPGMPEDTFGETVVLAARLGLHVVIETILTYFPEAAFCRDPISSQYIIHMAVESRDRHLFNIIYNKLKGDKLMRLPLHVQDSYGNSILHLAAKLSPPAILDMIPGSVLQFQHELKWFKEIEKLIRPHYQVRLNRNGESPKMIFTERHKDMKDKAEKWMKDTATSCTIIAALIGTIMFAAAITVPGGSDQNTGFPMFTEKSTFTIFAISDAISFITSIIALLMFMEIMMARYEAGDFMRQLPVRLFIGIGSLFISIFFMMLSFSTAVYLVFGQPRRWVLISVVTVTCYLVVLFGYLQGSLLLELVGSTYSGDLIPNHQRINAGSFGSSYFPISKVSHDLKRLFRKDKPREHEQTMNI